MAAHFDSDVDEVVATLEQAYADREAAAGVGREGALWVRTHRTWAHFAQNVTQLVQRVVKERGAGAAVKKEL